MKNFGQKHPLMVQILTLLFNLLILGGIYLSYLSFQEEHDTKVAYAEIELALKKQNINTHEIKVAKPFVRNQRAFTNTIWYTLAFTFKGQKYEATYREELIDKIITKDWAIRYKPEYQVKIEKVKEFQ